MANERERKPPTFCAICLSDRRPLTPTALSGKTYYVCHVCADEHPRSGRYAFDGGKYRGREDHASPAARGRCISKESWD